MKAADLRELTAEELQAKLKEMEEEIFNLKFQVASQQLENTARLERLTTGYCSLEDDNERKGNLRYWC